MIAIIFAEALFSITFLLGKLVLDDGRPFFVSGYRTLLGSIIIMSIYFIFFHYYIYITKNLVLRIFLMGFFYNYAAVGARFWGLQYVPIAKASFIYNMSPFLTTALSTFIFNHRLTRYKLLGLVIGFLGFIPVFYNSSSDEVLLSHFGVFSTAEIALVFASISAVIGNLLFKDIMERKACHFLFASSMSMFFGSILHFSTSLIIEEWNPIPVNDIYGFFLWGSLLTISSNIISYTIYGKLLEKYTASLMSFAGMLIPIFSTISGIIFLNESFEWYIIPALILIGIGLYIFYVQELRLGYIKK